MVSRLDHAYNLLRAKFCMLGNLQTTDHTNDINAAGDVRAQDAPCSCLDSPCSTKDFVPVMWT